MIISRAIMFSDSSFAIRIIFQMYHFSSESFSKWIQWQGESFSGRIIHQMDHFLKELFAEWIFVDSYQLSDGPYVEWIICWMSSFSGRFFTRQIFLQTNHFWGQIFFQTSHLPNKSFSDGPFPGIHFLDGLFLVFFNKSFLGWIFFRTLARMDVNWFTGWTLARMDDSFCDRIFWQEESLSCQIICRTNFFSEEYFTVHILFWTNHLRQIFIRTDYLREKLFFWTNLLPDQFLSVWLLFRTNPFPGGS